MKQTLQLLATCIFFALFSLAFSNTASAQELFWTDVATPVPEINNTYTITTPQELAWIAAQTNGGNNFSGKTVVLAANINLQGRSWVPIGTIDLSFNHFSGIFDGQGYGIDYLTINQNTGDAAYQHSGLFGIVMNGIVKNVWIGRNSYIKGGYNPNGIRTGGIAAAITNSKIENCYNLGEIFGGDGDHFPSCTGGIAGFVGNVTMISGCYNYAPIHKGMSALPSDIYTGGVVGFLTLYATLTLNSCYSLDQAGAGSGDVTLILGGSYGTINEQDCSILTTTQFKEKANFVGWDFLNTWTYLSGNSYAYPVLRVAATAGSAIDVQPQGGSVCSGGDYTFSVTASGTNPLYQWYKNGQQIPGATQSSYSVTSIRAQDVGDYKVHVSCDDNLSELSSSARLSLCEYITFLSQPTGASICMGGNHTLKVEAIGDNLSYQWYFNNQAIAGATSNQLALHNLMKENEGIYTVKVSNPTRSVMSDEAILIVNRPAQIIQDLMDASICEGSTYTLNPLFSGDELSYQWIKNDLIMPDATDGTLKITNATFEEDYDTYQVEVWGVCGKPVRSQKSRLWVAEKIPQPILFEVPDVAYRGQSTRLHVGNEFGYNDVTSYTWSFGAPNADIYTFDQQTVFVKFNTTTDSQRVSLRMEHVCGPYEVHKDIRVENPTGMEELKSENLTLFPSPFRSEVHIRGAEGCILHIVNASGVIVHTGKIENTEETILTGYLPEGVYLFRLEKDRKVITIKGTKE